jgi:hypothetical protein
MIKRFLDGLIRPALRILLTFGVFFREIYQEITRITIIQGHLAGLLALFLLTYYDTHKPMLSTRMAAVVLFSIAGVSSYAFAEQSACVERAIPVGLSTSDGAVAPTLNVSNFLGTYQSRPVVIKSVQVEERRPRVVLLVDTSGSMKLEGSNNAAFAEAVLSKLPADMEVGLAFFSTKAIPLVPPTMDHAKLFFPLEALRRGDYGNSGITALRSAVLDAVKMFGTPLLGDTVYLISDGGENNSKAQEKDVDEVVGSLGVRLFALMVRSGGIGIRSRAIGEEDGPAMLRTLVRAGGGTMVPKFGTTGVVSDLLGTKANETQLGREVNGQIEQVLNFYRLVITLAEPTDKPRRLNLTLQGFDRATSRKLELSYPTILGPCN